MQGVEIGEVSSLPDLLRALVDRMTSASYFQHVLQSLHRPRGPRRRLSGLRVHSGLLRTGFVR